MKKEISKIALNTILSVTLELFKDYHESKWRMYSCPGVMKGGISC
jgi:hypothetical protein